MRHENVRGKLYTMEATKELKYFLLILLGIALIWLFTGGQLRPASKSGPFLFQPQEKESGRLSRETTGSKDEPSPQEEISAKYDVFLSQGRATDTNPQEEYISITAARENPGPIKITGWKLMNKNGFNIKIKQGAKFISPSAVTQTQEDILLNPGDRAFVVTGRSPIGTSFRTSLCTGYFEQFNDFSPNLPLECPLSKEENLPGNLSDNCLDFIETIPRCQTPIFLPFNLPESCNAYINEKVNYKTCSEVHKNNANYYGIEWRIYLERGEEMWKQSRETITLFNESGNAVDSISY